MRNHGTCTNNCSRADSDSLQNDCIRSYPNVIFDDDYVSPPLLFSHRRSHFHSVIVIDEPAPACNKAFVTYYDPFGNIELTPGTDEAVVSDHNAGTRRIDAVVVEVNTVLDSASTSQAHLMGPSHVQGREC